MDSTSRGVREVTDDNPRQGTQRSRRSSSAARAPGSDAPSDATRVGRRAPSRDGDMVPSSDRTQLGVRRAVAAPPEPHRTQHGRRAGVEEHPHEAGDSAPTTDDEVVRFGPGVPQVAAPVAPTWGPSAPRRRRARWRGVLGTLLTAALVAAVLWFLLPGGEPLRVAAAGVAPTVEPGRACDVTVDVVGTVTTNGRPGTITYQWERSDGQTSAVLSQTVPEGTSVVEVHLMWTLSGTGTYPAQATLRVLTPDASEAVGGFTYRC